MKKVYIGPNFKKILAALSLKKAQIARRIECSTGYLSDIEADKKSPGVDFLNSLYREYKVDVNFLITGQGEMFVSDATAQQNSHTYSIAADQASENPQDQYLRSEINEPGEAGHNMSSKPKDLDKENRRQEAIKAGARAIKNVYHASDLAKLIEDYQILKQENEQMTKQIEELQVRLNQTEKLISLMHIVPRSSKNKKESHP